MGLSKGRWWPSLSSATAEVRGEGTGSQADLRLLQCRRKGLGMGIEVDLELVGGVR